MTTGLPGTSTNHESNLGSAADDLRAYYKAYDTRNLGEADHCLVHLDRHFQGIKLADINAAAIMGYVVKREGMGKASGTINVELATLKKL